MPAWSSVNAFNGSVINEEFYGGVLGEIGVGYKYNTRRRLELLFSIGYKLQQFRSQVTQAQVIVDQNGNLIQNNITFDFTDILHTPHFQISIGL